jgi:restriction system protein
MNNAQIREITEKIDRLEEESNAIEAERRLLDILTPLLEADGYYVEHTGGSGDNGIDFLAKKDPADDQSSSMTIGIQYKHYRPDRPVALDIVQQVIGISLLNNVDRMILLSRSGFSKSALYAAKRDLPTSVELIDLDALRAWVSRVERSLRDDYSKVIRAITDLSKLLARIIAQNPRELDHIEWRDMERILASVFDGLGFRVELTPASKDGGKDIILEFGISGMSQSYLVEVKHWRSRQKVGQGYISHFVDVVAGEKRQGGLYLATYGYSNSAFEALTEIEKTRIRLGSEEKIVSLCRTYTKAESGLWSAPPMLTDLLFEETASV